MRPPKKSIIQQEKERLKADVAIWQPTPGPSNAKARLVKGSDQHPTPGPSNLADHRQKNVLEPEKKVVRQGGTEHVGTEGTYHALLFASSD
ncbi:hypothetical protein JVT61DRAFT_6980 [Boletus reticuloceps]|uniref:Uncharacterized protein n=1 Tax=Boletus reticuloceps TaxID=495285 RepID=A0A8I2YJI9_9AGAM|nr:hypothetical protein JVT61DRAFT_6980 [Boletus reticuloceps]